MSTYSEGDRVRVRLRPDCTGGDRPHAPSEDTVEGRITALTGTDDHRYFVLFRGGILIPSAAFPRRILGRHYTAEELEQFVE